MKNVKLIGRLRIRLSGRQCALLFVLIDDMPEVLIVNGKADTDRLIRSEDGHEPLNEIAQINIKKFLKPLLIVAVQEVLKLSGVNQLGEENATSVR